MNNDPTISDVISHDTDVDDFLPTIQHPYISSPVEKQFLKIEIKFILNNDVIGPNEIN